MSLDDWILALHLLASFAFVGAIIGFWAMVIAAWRIDRPSDVRAIFRLNPYLTACVAAGSLATLVFGIWLAVSLDAYEVWDGWIITAIVLWIAATHAMPAWNTAPRLVIKAPEKRCGKSRLLDLIEGLCHRPILTATASRSAVYR